MNDNKLMLIKLDSKSNRLTHYKRNETNANLLVFSSMVLPKIQADHKSI